MHSSEDHNLTQDALDADAHAHGSVGDNATPDVDDETANQLAEAHSQMAYLAAEFENYKRQTNRRLEEATTRAKRGVLEDILPALDNFLLAQKYAGSAQSAEQVKTGLDYVAQQMETALEQAGLEPIRAQGAMFDPAPARGHRRSLRSRRGPRHRRRRNAARLPLRRPSAADKRGESRKMKEERSGEVEG